MCVCVCVAMVCGGNGVWWQWCVVAMVCGGNNVTQVWIRLGNRTFFLPNPMTQLFLTKTHKEGEKERNVSNLSRRGARPEYDGTGTVFL